jgi:hypothetical protein
VQHSDEAEYRQHPQHQELDTTFLDEQHWRKAALTLGIDEQIDQHLDERGPACEQRFIQLVDAMNALNMAKQHLDNGHLSKHIRSPAYIRGNGELRHASRVLAREIKRNADDHKLSEITLPQHMPTCPYESTTTTALHHGSNRPRPAPPRGSYCENTACIQNPDTDLSNRYCDHCIKGAYCSNACFQTDIRGHTLRHHNTPLQHKKPTEDTTTSRPPPL